MHPDGNLDVVGIWPTIQGEGPYAGTPATFVRLAGCNLECPGCDTDYTRGRKLYNPRDLFDMVRANGNNLVVITGGEPFRQNLHPFVRLLKYYMHTVQVETNGTLPPTSKLIDSIVCSPKTPGVNPDLRRRINAWKYIIQEGKVDPDDGLPTSSLGMKGKPARPIGRRKVDVYVQPFDANNEFQNKLNMQAAVESCMKHGYRLSLQMHKIAHLA